MGTKHGQRSVSRTEGVGVKCRPCPSPSVNHASEPEKSANTIFRSRTGRARDGRPACSWRRRAHCGAGWPAAGPGRGPAKRSATRTSCNNACCVILIEVWIRKALRVSASGVGTCRSDDCTCSTRAAQYRGVKRRTREFYIVNLTNLTARAARVHAKSSRAEACNLHVSTLGQHVMGRDAFTHRHFERDLDRFRAAQGGTGEGAGLAMADALVACRSSSDDEQRLRLRRRCGVASCPLALDRSSDRRQRQRLLLRLPDLGLTD